MFNALKALTPTVIGTTTTTISGGTFAVTAYAFPGMSPTKGCTVMVHMLHDDPEIARKNVMFPIFPETPILNAQDLSAFAATLEAGISDVSRPDLMPVIHEVEGVDWDPLKDPTAANYPSAAQTLERGVAAVRTRGGGTIRVEQREGLRRSIVRIPKRGKFVLMASGPLVMGESLHLSLVPVGADSPEPIVFKSHPVTSVDMF